MLKLSPTVVSPYWLCVGKLLKFRLPRLVSMVMLSVTLVTLVTLVELIFSLPRSLKILFPLLTTFSFVGIAGGRGLQQIGTYVNLGKVAWNSIGHKKLKMPMQYSLNRCSTSH